MFTLVALLGLSLVPAPFADHGTTTVLRPRIEVWSNHGDGVYTRGQGVRVYFRADQDGFVTLFRVDTDGRVRVLFPRDPSEDNFVRGGHEYEALGSSQRDAFYVDDYPGVGYLFAVVAADPFDYRAIERGNHWDYRTIADGRVRGDPYVALTELAERIVPENYAEWDYDIVPYYVERHYDYPRFLCYDCHAYASYTYWDPYWRSCVRFRIVMYDDPYYYPYRYYGRRVVFVRPFRPQPRFVFKDRDGSGRDNFVTRERVRPVNDDTRRTPATRRTTGTAGVVPTPRDDTRRDRPSTGGAVRNPIRDNDDGRREPERRETPQTGGGRREPERRETPQVNRGDDNRGRSRTVEPDRDKRPDAPRSSRSQPQPRAESPRSPSRSEPRPTPRAESPRPPSRSEPRAAPRAESPRSRNEPQARAQPRQSPPRAEPRGNSGGSKSKPQSQPELRRRKPD